MIRYQRKSAIILFGLIAASILCRPSLKDLYADEPVYTVKKTTQEIIVDGNIIEEDWQYADSIRSFVFPWFESGKKERTTVRLLWDDYYLYVCFRCEDENIAAHHFERNSSVSRDDCAEIFLSPNSKMRLWYANYEINSIGTWLVGLNKGSERYKWEPVGFLAGRSHKGTINNENDLDSFWILELAIPFDNFKKFDGNIPPQDGDVWGLNLNRCGGDVNPQYSQWTASRTDRPNFHRPEDFGSLLFLNNPVRD